MAKSIITESGDIVNYGNIVAITVKLCDVENDNGQLWNNVYGVIAIDVNNSEHLLGAYQSEKEAVEAKNKLKNWLQIESYGIFAISNDGGDNDSI